MEKSDKIHLLQAFIDFHTYRSYVPSNTSLCFFPWFRLILKEKWQNSEEFKSPRKMVIIALT